MEEKKTKLDVSVSDPDEFWEDSILKGIQSVPIKPIKKQEDQTIPAKSKTDKETKKTG